MHKKISCLLLFLLLSIRFFAQQVLPVPVEMKNAYDKKTRSPNGLPGTMYWQNTAAYTIDISFDPISRQVTGVEHIKYFNNSPDTLTEIWMKLYPNLYKKGSPREQSIKASDVSDGVLIRDMKIGDSAISENGYMINATNMIVHGGMVLPRSSVEIACTFSYTLNKASHIRTGEIKPGADFVAYFFPRIAVYDDIDGWNKLNYNGEQEFYNDFCSFDVQITVPKNTVVWATGDLLNADSVFTPKFSSRFKNAINSDRVTDIISVADLKDENITADRSYNTWHFLADSVTDFAFAVSDHYVWKSAGVTVDKSTGRRTRVDAVYDPLDKDYEVVIDHALATVKHMSYDFPAWPYPYAHETVFDGLDQMEYPMMVNDNPLDDVTVEIELTDHEIFHTMFPFYMGVNETKYAWMDEGWATIGEWLISPMIDSSIFDDYGLVPYESNAGREVDLPIITLSTNLVGTSYYLNSYPKPALGYLYVKDLLGDSLFFKALHYYIKTWEGRHPTPLDFFNCMNIGSGQNLDWFWNAWFYKDGIPDIGIGKVFKKGKGYSVEIWNKGGKPVPVSLKLDYKDGTSQLYNKKINVWKEGKRNFIIQIRSEKELSRISIDSQYNVDANMSNNVYNF